MNDHDNLCGWLRQFLAPMVLALAILRFGMPAQAQPYTMNWYKVAGGGGMNSTGGIYKVEGTIGQHDAVRPLSGGGFQLTGGFWSMISVLQTQGAPTLNIRLIGTTVSVYWQAVPGWTLEQNHSLTNAPGWTTSSGVTTSGGTNYLNLVSPTGYLFYRLANP